MLLLFTLIKILQTGFPVASSDNRYPIEYFIDTHHDIGKTALIEDMESVKFRTAPSSRMNFGFSAHPVWLRAKIQNLEDTQLSLRYFSMNSVSVYFFKQQQLLDSLILTQPPLLGTRVPLSLNSKQPHVVLIKLVSNAPINISLSFDKAFVPDALTYTLFGICLTLWILALITRQKSYILIQSSLFSIPFIQGLVFHPDITSGLMVCLLGQVILLIHAKNQFKSELTTKQVHSNQKNLLKKEVIKEINHQFSSPLINVMQAYQNMRRTDLSSHQTEYLAIIKDSTESILRKFNEYTDYSDLMQDTIEINHSAFHLQTFCNECLPEMEAIAQHKCVQLIFSIKPGTETEFIGDHYRIRQILMAILDFSVDKTPNGNVSVRMETVRDAKTVFLKIVIRDTSTGDKHPDEPNNTDFKTVKLMLAQKLVIMLNGHLNIDREGIHGTRYQISLPLEKQPQAQGKIEFPYDSLKSRHILFMTYDAEYGITMSEQANSEDVPFSLALSIRQAIRNLTHAVNTCSAFNLIIVDGTRDSDSLEAFICQIREMTNYANTPILLLASPKSQGNFPGLFNHTENLYIHPKPSHFLALASLLIKIMMPKHRLGSEMFSRISQRI